MPWRNIEEKLFHQTDGRTFVKLIVEAAVDINGLMAVELGESPPQNYYSSFLKLGEMEILPEYLQRIEGFLEKWKSGREPGDS
ncbi:hypothetical protein LR013_02305 [candidate division NPL-UPA2 bacterium]|nr:hypothetical protein [candidate division NPL-UPA2 bacterium]